MVTFPTQTTRRKSRDYTRYCTVRHSLHIDVDYVVTHHVVWHTYRNTLFSSHQGAIVFLSNSIMSRTKNLRGRKSPSIDRQEDPRRLRAQKVVYAVCSLRARSQTATRCHRNITGGVNVVKPFLLGCEVSHR